MEKAEKNAKNQSRFSDPKTRSARKSETLNRAPYPSTVLAEFSDFEGMLDLYTCNNRSSHPPLVSSPPLCHPDHSVPSASLCSTAAYVRVGVNVDRARVNRASYNIRGGRSVGVGMSPAWACVLYSSRRYHFHGNF